MKTSEIRAALSRRWHNVKFSRKLNVWTMTDPERTTALARRRVVVLKPAAAEAEAADIVAFHEE